MEQEYQFTVSQFSIRLNVASDVVEQLEELPGFPYVDKSDTGPITLDRAAAATWALDEAGLSREALVEWRLALTLAMAKNTVLAPEHISSAIELTERFI